jgi:hypothetical protein
MAGSNRRKGSNRGRAAIDWEAAFLCYAWLPARERSYQAVADAYGVSVRTVEAHGRAGSWRQRLAEIEAEAAAEAARELTQTRAAQLADVQKLVEASFLSYAKQLRSGQIRLSAADLPRLVKLLQELSSPPGEQLHPGEQADHARSAPPLTPLERKLQVVRALHEADALHALEALAEPRQAEQADRDDDDPNREDEPEHDHQDKYEHDERADRKDHGHAQP